MRAGCFGHWIPAMPGMDDLGLSPRQLAGAAAIILIGAGCTGLKAPVAPPDLPLAPENPEAPDPVAESSAAALSAVPDTGWWTSFGDPALDRIVTRALARNLTLEGAAARLAQAAADAGIARSALYPQLGAGADRLAERRNFIGLPIPGTGGDEVLTAEYVAYGLSLDLSWEMNLWRAATPAARAANAGFEAALAEVAGARISLAGQIARLYFLALEAREQTRIADALAANLERSARLVRERARVGRAHLAEVDTAAARLAAAQGEAASRRQASSAAVRSLEVLLNDYPDGDPGPDWDLGPRLAGPDSPAPPGVPADLVSRRPDVASAERRLAASREFTQIARRARYPQFRLTSSAGTASARLRQLVNGDFSVWSLIAGIAAPVFQGGRIRARIRREEARDREALAAYAGTVLTAYQEVEAGLAAEEALREAEVRAAEALAASRRAWLRSEAQWRSGLVSRRAAEDAERAALAAESAHLARVRARLDNRVNLFLALGGGFESPPRSHRSSRECR